MQHELTGDDLPVVPKPWRFAGLCWQQIAWVVVGLLAITAVVFTVAR